MGARINKVESRRAQEHLITSSLGLPNSLQQLLKSNGCIEIRGNDQHCFFEKLARTVVGQQLSTAAAKSIWSRITNLCDQKSLSPFDLALTYDGIELRRCGISTAKARTIKEISIAISEGDIVEEQLTIADQKTIVEELTSIWGIGKWTAEMIAISYFGLPDVWSMGDASLNRGIKILSDNKPRVEKKIIQVARPYRSYLAKHIWFGIDAGIL